MANKKQNKKTTKRAKKVQETPETAQPAGNPEAAPTENVSEEPVKASRMERSDLSW